MTGIGVPQDILPSAFFKSIVENTCSAHFISSEGRVLYANPVFKTLTGYSTGELVESDPFKLFSEAPETAMQLQALLSDHSPGGTQINAHLSAGHFKKAAGEGVAGGDGWKN
jgi:PAS domain S-box-containing protein